MHMFIQYIIQDKAQQGQQGVFLTGYASTHDFRPFREISPYPVFPNTFRGWRCASTQVGSLELEKKLFRTNENFKSVNKAITENGTF